MIEEVSEAKDKQKDAEIYGHWRHRLTLIFCIIPWIPLTGWRSKEKNSYSINKRNQMASMEEMADWLEKYISLQQMRFNHSFQFKLNIEERAKKVMIYKLLLQPFVENAIIHGFKGMEKGGVLRVDIFVSEAGEKLNIIIEDNGKGMPKEIAETFNVREQAIKDGGSSIGLHNAFVRMDMYYGKEAAWNMNSIEGMGTVITLTIPLHNAV